MFERAIEVSVKFFLRFPKYLRKSRQHSPCWGFLIIRIILSHELISVWCLCVISASITVCMPCKNWSSSFGWKKPGLPPVGSWVLWRTQTRFLFAFLKSLAFSEISLPLVIRSQSSCSIFKFLGPVVLIWPLLRVKLELGVLWKLIYCLMKFKLTSLNLKDLKLPFHFFTTLGLNFLH